MILQQSGRIKPLPGEGARRQSDAAGAHPSPRVIVLHSYERAARVRRCAHAPQVVAEEILRSLVAAPHADDVGAETVEVRRCAADGALPEVSDGDDGRAVARARHPRAGGVIGVGFGHARLGDAGELVPAVPDERPPAAAREVAIGVVGIRLPADADGGVRARLARRRVLISHAGFDAQVPQPVVGIRLAQRRRGDRRRRGGGGGGGGRRRRAGTSAALVRVSVTTTVSPTGTTDGSTARVRVSAGSGGSTGGAGTGAGSGGTSASWTGGVERNNRRLHRRRHREAAVQGRNQREGHNRTEQAQTKHDHTSPTERLARRRGMFSSGAATPGDDDQMMRR